MEKCLDITLKTLKDNWDKKNNERDFLKRTDLLEKFELPEVYKKDEFFNRIIEKLKIDGYVEIIEDDYNSPFTKPDIYEQRTLITIEGFFFINSGGYRRKKFREKAKTVANIANIGILLIASVVAAYYYWNHRNEKEELQYKQPIHITIDTLRKKV